ncbi:CerR family C-terminal domain-containing protein [Chitinibacteraceae bacterium HSL-7]
MAQTPPTSNSRSNATRLALISAATEVFARSGFEAVGTREIAAAADVHPALIGYHFGSKEGLYLAVFEQIASLMEQRIGPALAAIDEALTSPGSATEVTQRSLVLLGQLSDNILAILAAETSAPWGQLIVREQQSPSPAFDLIYERFMQRVLNTMTRLVRAADPSRPEPAARLVVVTLLGQMLVFRVAREGVLRHLGWQSLTPAQLAEAQAMVRENLYRLCAPRP